MELGFIQQTKVIGGYQGFVQHKQIFEAIKNKNSELARKYMSEHINCTRKRLLELCMDTEAKIL
jgi:DNA-binding GntR family transcriptional regulator